MGTLDPSSVSARVFFLVYTTLMQKFSIEQRPTPSEFCQDNDLPAQVAEQIFLRPHHLLSYSAIIKDCVLPNGQLNEPRARQILTEQRIKNADRSKAWIQWKYPPRLADAELEYAEVVNVHQNTLTDTERWKLQNYVPKAEDFTGMVTIEIQILHSLLSQSPETPVVIADVLDKTCRVKSEKGFSHCNIRFEPGGLDTNILAALYVLSLREGSEIKTIPSESTTPIAYTIPAKLIQSKSFIREVERQLSGEQLYRVVEVMNFVLEKVKKLLASLFSGTTAT